MSGILQKYRKIDFEEGFTFRNHLLAETGHRCV